MKELKQAFISHYDISKYNPLSGSLKTEDVLWTLAGWAGVPVNGNLINVRPDKSKIKKIFYWEDIENDGYTFLWMEK